MACDDALMHPWPPPDPRRSDFRARITAWVETLVEPSLVRAVPSLAEWPQAAGRVAWRTTLAVIHARGKDDAGVLSMSAVIPPGDLSGLMPEEDIATLRALMLDPAEAPDAAALRARLGYLEQFGKHLPRHYLT